MPDYEIPYPRIPEDGEEFGWRKNLAPKLAIFAMGLFVVAFDSLCKSGNTISEEVWRMRRTKLGQFLVPLVVDSVSEHLLEEVPQEVDPIHHIANLSPKKVKPRLDGSDRFDIFPADDT